MGQDEWNQLARVNTILCSDHFKQKLECWQWEEETVTKTDNVERIEQKKL